MRASTFTPAFAAALMRFFKTPHASAAVVLLASSPRSALMALQTARNFPSTSRARLRKEVTASAYARSVACALTLVSSPLQLAGAPVPSSALEQPELAAATSRPSDVKRTKEERGWRS